MVPSPSSLLLISEPSLSAVLYAYIGGVLSSFTPCVYPVIPITLTIVGARGAQSRVQSFRNSALYVGGMILTYTLLGIISARAGSLFGATLQRPFIVIPFALMLAFLAISELDVIPLRVFARIQHRAQRVGGGGSWFAIVLMGGASGLVAAPCIGPVLATILGIAASSGSEFWGGALLFAYSLGLGTIFLVLGTFSHLTQRLPRSGQWLTVVKSILAVSLLVIALLFVRRWLPDSAIPQWLACMLGGTLLIPLVRSHGPQRKALRLTSALGCALLLTYGISSPQLAPSGNSSPPLDWISSLEDGQRKALDTKKPIFVDFFAEWCAACKQIDTITLSDPTIHEELRNHWITVRIDMTDQTAEADALQRQFGVQGLPTLLFFSPGGKGVHPSRVTEFIDAPRLLSILQTLRADS